MTLRGRHNGTLDCQDCGDVVRYLSKEEAQMVAHDPYAFIGFCGPCGRTRMEEIERARG